MWRWAVSTLSIWSSDCPKNLTHKKASPARDMHCAYHGRGRLVFYMTLCSIHLPLIKRAIKQMSRQSQSMNMPSQTPASPRWNCSTKT